MNVRIAEDPAVHRFVVREGEARTDCGVIIPLFVPDEKRMFRETDDIVDCMACLVREASDPE